ncbi:hypothetical protein K9U39_14750 [Rhodoblastus acidophilus]|uniref:Uncharacterized protein n=1 Tax=Candidatus Rhodoblastus alkanivorans TaxID=2954117 RepID=A0ABS9ZAY7_9HYPH|nr:hypothetical protein [Candidatus Rhodoblastus alkanivorans]MCI4679388.1 hypothetical protein [Candidatus Rhodoblastus alkanivorans]MCI4684864.1 hypothetical protein [Candidatus Rhodoblastus alkanivorans]MDI4642188.1 hypothetical protein [Rhodoblastus acidophilus]
MQNLSFLSKALALAAFAAFAASPAAATVRTAQGQTYWSGDPGQVDPGAYWSGGQDHFDPHHYLSWYGGDPQDYQMTVYSTHRGAARCVWRERVINTYWDFQHPYVRVCD